MKKKGLAVLLIISMLLGISGCSVFGGVFGLEKTGSFLPCPGSHSEDEMVQLYPQRDGTDGFFIARMKRFH